MLRLGSFAKFIKISTVKLLRNFKLNSDPGNLLPKNVSFYQVVYDANCKGFFRESSSLLQTVKILMAEVYHNNAVLKLKLKFQFFPPTF